MATPKQKSRKPRLARVVGADICSQVLERDNFMCQYCGSMAGDTDQITGGPVWLEVDHVVPKRRGGDDSPSNLRAICSTCYEGRRHITVQPQSADQLWAMMEEILTEDEQKQLFGMLEERNQQSPETKHA